MTLGAGGYFRVAYLRVFGAPVYVHWSVPLACAAILVAGYSEPVFAALFVAAYFLLILLHEVGHAFVATRFGCRIVSIRMTFLHGECTYESPWYEREDIFIAWGGVLAQMLIALPLVGISFIFEMRDMGYLRPVVVVMGYFSLLLVAINLAPSDNLDGGRAWKLIPIAIKEMGQNAKAKKKRMQARVRNGKH